MLAATTADEEPAPPDGLDRLADVLTEAGPEAVYRAGPLLSAPARLAEDDPAEYACRRTHLQRAGIKLRDLGKALAPLRQTIRRERPPPDAAGWYRVSGGRIVRAVLTRDGPVEVPLATWAGRIVEEIIRDDGAERSVALAVEGTLADGTPLLRVEVPATEWPWMRWPVQCWGTRAVVPAGVATADHLRCALQLLSGNVPRRAVHAHPGWRRISESRYYLHGGGAIGPDGPDAGIVVSLPDPLAGFLLPGPPTGADRAAALRASLGLLRLSPERVMFPLLAAVYRAVLGETDFALHLAGPTGCYQSEAAALAQQPFGAGMDARHLPAKWSSTGNALEGPAFTAKDALLAVDDFCPTGSGNDVQRCHREADRLFRGQGNRAGRQRMRAEATVGPAKPPRGLVLSTGEDTPRSQSLRARLLVLEV